MLIPKRILIAPKVQELIIKHGLNKQFLKAKNNLLAGFVLGSSQLKKREPKKDDIWYFRINKQYRVLGEFDEEGNFFVLSLDDHQ